MRRITLGIFLSIYFSCVLFATGEDDIEANSNFPPTNNTFQGNPINTNSNITGPGTQRNDRDYDDVVVGIFILTKILGLMIMFPSDSVD